MKIFLPFILLLALFIGCGEKKVDTAKLTSANEMINSGEYEKGIAMLDAMGKDSPNDTALKQARVNAHFRYANFFMFNDSLPPKQKYPNALKQYRAVLAIEPNHAQAKEGADMIISIYKSMNREVPSL